MRDRFSGWQKLKVVTHFQQQYLTCGITPNSLHAIQITHLDIHLKHTWELAWVIKGNLCKTPSKFRNFHCRPAVIVETLPISKRTKVDIYSLKARFSYLLWVFPLQSCFFHAKSGVKRWNWSGDSAWQSVPWLHVTSQVAQAHYESPAQHYPTKLIN